MAKLTLNTIGSRYGSIDALNDNSDLIEAAFENTLSRDGTGPNNMESDLDMDSNRIINLSNGSNPQDAVTKSQLDVNKAEVNALVQSLATSSYGDANNVSYVPAGVSAVATTVQTKLRQTVSVKDFGAVGNGVADDTAAIQAALSWALSSNVRGKVTIPAGTYRTTAAIDVSGVGIVLEGETGERASVIVGDFDGDWIIKVRNRYSGISNMEIRPGPARLTGSGVLVESQDTPFARPTNCTFKNLTILDQPSEGMRVVGACWFSTFDTITTYNNGTHGLRFDNGSVSGRIYKENPGICIINNLSSYNNGGHGLFIGNNNEVSNRGLRFQINNADLFGNAEIAGSRKSATQMWAFIDTSHIDACAFDGQNIAQTASVTRGIDLYGRAVTIDNTRFLSVIPNCVFIGDIGLGGYISSGFTIKNILIFDKFSDMQLDPVISVDSAVLNVEIALGATSEAYAPISVLQNTPFIKRAFVSTKAADQTVNNTTTEVDVVGMSLPLQNKERVEFKAVIWYQGDSSADITFQFTTPIGALIRWAPAGSIRIAGGDNLVVQDAITTAGTPVVFGAAASRRLCEISGYIETVGNAGDLTLQFAQAVATVADTTVGKGSYLIGWRNM